MMRIRKEHERDRKAVRAVNERAFERSAEANLVDDLRGAARAYVSLVAVEDGEIVGHIFFSPVEIDTDPSLQVMGLAPMAVLPEHQRKGIGSDLVRSGLAACTELGADAVVVLGHAEYYPRFGFQPASKLGLTSEYDVPDDVFMALELRPGSLADVRGVARYHEAFNRAE